MTELTELQIDEVSFVPAGANPEAKIVLFKRKKSVGKDERAGELLAALQALTDKLNAQAQRNEEAQFKLFAERYAILGTDADKLAQMLLSASKENPQLYKAALKVLDSALTAVKKSGTFDEIGKVGSAPSHNAQSQIQRFAAQIQKSNPNLTRRQALDAAYLRHPELQ